MGQAPHEDRQKPSTRGTPVVLVAMAMLGVLAPLMLGSVHPWAVSVLCAGSGMLLMLHARARRTQQRRVAPGPLPWVMLGGAAYSALQAVPLPLELLRALSPRAAEVWDAMRPDDASGGVGFISCAPHETATAAAGLAALAALCAVSLDLGREERHRRTLLWLGAAGPVVMLVVTVLQTLSQQSPLSDSLMRQNALLVSTFINPNHAGACWLVGLFAMAGLALTARDRGAQVQALGVALALLGAVFFSTSNASVVAALAGSALLSAAVWHLARRGVRERGAAPGEEDALKLARRSRTVSLVLLTATLPLALVAVKAPELAPRGAAVAKAWDLKRATITEGALTIAHVAGLGLGRGAFAEGFPRYKQSPTAYRYIQPESLPVLLAVEWGVPAAVLYVLGWLWVAVSWARRLVSAAHAAALCAGAALVLENLADFSLEALGVAFPLFIVLGAARGPAGSAAMPSPQGRARAQRRSTRWATVCGAAVMVVVAMVPGWALLSGQEPSRSRALALPLPARLGALEAHLQHHPTDSRAGVALARAWRAQEPPNLQTALRWLSRVLLLNPTMAEAHADAGHTLWSLGRAQQAVLEWRDAARMEVVNVDPVPVGSLLQRGVPVEALLDVYASRGSPLAVCGEVNRLGYVGRMEQCLQQVLLLHPETPDVRALLAGRCADRGEWAEAERWAREELAARPAHAAATLVLARALDAAGKRGDADRLLESARTRRADPVEVDRFVLTRAMASGDAAAARAALVSLSEGLRQRDLPQVEVTLAEGRLLEREGRMKDAFVAYRNAARADPQRLDGALNASRVASQLGLKEAAMQVLREAANVNPAPEYLAALDRLDARPKPAPTATP